MLNYLTCSVWSSFCLKSGFLSDFEWIWVRRWLFHIIEGQGRNPCFERVPAPEQFFPPKSHRSAFKLRSIKVKRFTILSRTFQSKIHPNGPGLALEENQNLTVFERLECVARSIRASHKPSIIRNSQRRTQIHSKSLEKPLLRQKDDYTPQVR